MFYKINICRRSLRERIIQFFNRLRRLFVNRRVLKMLFAFFRIILYLLNLLRQLS